mmetsp:Transcript_39175/g.63502  ORF Transcript_39175/g.63502 Transcript_39175/m.63502 type:complete len:254 (+) Transcript_39175:51-812(+)
MHALRSSAQLAARLSRNASNQCIQLNWLASSSNASFRSIANRRSYSTDEQTKQPTTEIPISADLPRPGQAEIEERPETRHASTPGPGQVIVEVKELDQLREQAKKITEFQDKFLRGLAEAENARRRAAIDVENARKYSLQSFAKGLIDVLDVLQLALNSVPSEVRSDATNPYVQNLYMGIEAVEKELIKSFEKHGIVRVNPLGEKFDPNLHEALFEMDDPSKEPGTVAHVDKPGYMVVDRLLRAAKVGVVRKR